MGLSQENLANPKTPIQESRWLISSLTRVSQECNKLSLESQMFLSGGFRSLLLFTAVQTIECFLDELLISAR